MKDLSKLMLRSYNNEARAVCWYWFHSSADSNRRTLRRALLTRIGDLE